MAPGCSTGRIWRQLEHVADRHDADQLAVVDHRDVAVAVRRRGCRTRPGRRRSGATVSGVGRHPLGDLGRRRVGAGRRGPHQVALGEDADGQPGVDDDDRAHAPLDHPGRRLGQVVRRRRGQDVRRHDLGDRAYLGSVSHPTSSFAATASYRASSGTSRTRARTPRMQATPPDTTENRADVEGGHRAGLGVAQLGPAGDHRDVDRRQPAPQPVGHGELEDRVAEHRGDDVGGAGQGQHEPGRAGSQGTSPKAAIAAPHTSTATITARPCRRTRPTHPVSSAPIERAGARRGVEQADGERRRRRRSRCPRAGNRARGMPKTMASMSIRNVLTRRRRPLR